MKPLLISSGEPAGIGPDLCLILAGYDLPIVVLADYNLLISRARELDINVHLHQYKSDQTIHTEPGHLTILPVHCPAPIISGQLNPQNAVYVLDMLTLGVTLCAQGEFSAFVTAPVHKANINAAGIPFTGHTEFLAEYFKVDDVVMMLACQKMRVALVTTHLPLSQVPQAITIELVNKVITQVDQSLKNDFGIRHPKIKVAGLNPHAGESGYLGREEIEVITPALIQLREQGVDVKGPFPADTMYTNENNCDAYVAMYHDQGLPVLKFAGFGQSVNVTLGLPIIRTSVDHGTALELAGKNSADSGSMLEAVNMALSMARTRIK